VKSSHPYLHGYAKPLNREGAQRSTIAAAFRSVAAEHKPAGILRQLSIYQQQQYSCAVATVEQLGLR
jgi:hypothetical protein